MDTQHSQHLTEQQLVSSLQPIRQFVLAQAIFHYLASGLHDAIAAETHATVAEISARLSMDEARLHGFLGYLANEGLVELVGEHVRSTSHGCEAAAARPWYELLVGGYAPALQQLTTCLHDRGRYATRDTAAVGRGSCGISQHDALPMTRELFDRISPTPRTVVDIGCGDGSYLLNLCQALPGVRGVGIETDATSVASAMSTVRNLGLDDRVTVRLGSATALPDLAGEPGPICFITAFVLQELLEQSGRAAITDLLTSSFRHHPDASWIVIEVDHRPNDSAVMNTGLGLAYYNAYYLLHTITQQRLETVRFWETLYREAGLAIDATAHPDSTYDSLGLKVGFLLSLHPPTAFSRS